MGFATQGKRASREEMQKVERLGGQIAPSGPKVHTPSGALSTAAQQSFIKRLAKQADFDDEGLLNLIHELCERDDVVLELLKSHEASKVIERLKWILKA